MSLTSLRRTQKNVSIILEKISKMIIYNKIQTPENSIFIINSKNNIYIKKNIFDKNIINIILCIYNYEFLHYVYDKEHDKSIVIVKQEKHYYDMNKLNKIINILNNFYIECTHKTYEYNKINNILNNYKIKFEYINRLSINQINKTNKKTIIYKNYQNHVYIQINKSLNHFIISFTIRVDSELNNIVNMKYIYENKNNNIVMNNKLFNIFFDKEYFDKFCIRLQNNIDSLLNNACLSLL